MQVPKHAMTTDMFTCIPRNSLILLCVGIPVSARVTTSDLSTTWKQSPITRHCHCFHLPAALVWNLKKGVRAPIIYSSICSRATADNAAYCQGRMRKDEIFENNFPNSNQKRFTKIWTNSKLRTMKLDSQQTLFQYFIMRWKKNSIHMYQNTACTFWLAIC